MPRLEWTHEQGFFRFYVTDGGHRVPVEAWAGARPVRSVDGKASVLAPLLRLLEREVALEQIDGAIEVPDEAIAQLTATELSGLGLPAPAPYHLELLGQGLVSDPDFRFRWQFVHSTGRPVMGCSIAGSVLVVGEGRYVLTEPYYSLISSLKAFTQASSTDTARRLTALADIQATLPDDVRIGEYFRGIRIVRADTLTLRPFMNSAGEPDFDPVLVTTHRPGADVHNSETAERKPALPESPEREWQRFFRGLAQVRSSYPAGSGWYVVIPDPLREALQVVRQFQHAGPQERRNFLRNPRTFLEEQLGDRLSPEALDALFWESGEYSERVREIGVWTPRVIAYLKPSGQEWLPPAEVGIRVDDVMVALDSTEIAPLRQAITEAIERGEPAVQFNGWPIPATSETLEALEQVERATRRSPEAVPGKEDEQRPAVIALIIKDNLDELGYESTRRPGSRGSGTQPNVLKSELLPHQEEGYRWLQELWCSGVRGGLLADDMGLGKTLQALVFLAWVQEQEHASGRAPGPILTVAPTGLLKNWRAEHDLHLHVPGLGDTVEAHGPGIRALRLHHAARANELAGGLPVLDVEQLRNTDWVLTTYETLRDYQHSFGRIRWKVVVFDEAQRIKNPATLMTDAAKAMNADFWLALTGTPVENSLSDLWSIIDTIRAGSLGSLREFMATYDTAEGNRGQMFGRLKALLMQESRPPVVKRRMKADHLDGLPAIQVHVRKRDMPEPQAKAYADAIRQARARAGAPGNMLAALHHMRAVSLHPDARGDEPDEAFLSASARTADCFEVLDCIRDKGQKALVFLEDIALQAQLAEIIQRRYRMPQPPLLINGEVAGPRRKQRVDIFQERRGFDVMLLSPRAGGVGLTLTAANHVIHLSRWWNPAVEDQCTDRVYRIGQAREVHVYLPMAIHPDFRDHSFDVRLHALLEAKRALSRTVLAPTATTSAELEGLYREAVEQS